MSIIKSLTLLAAASLVLPSGVAHAGPGVDAEPVVFKPLRKFGGFSFQFGEDQSNMSYEFERSGVVHYREPDGSYGRADWKSGPTGVYATGTRSVGGVGSQRWGFEWYGVLASKHLVVFSDLSGEGRFVFRCDAKKKCSYAASTPRPLIVELIPAAKDRTLFEQVLSKNPQTGKGGAGVIYLPGRPAKHARKTSEVWWVRPLRTKKFDDIADVLTPVLGKAPTKEWTFSKKHHDFVVVVGDTKIN